MKAVELSARMQAFADMVSGGSVVCDVGCDHGWVSIYLIQQGIASKVFAIRPTPCFCHIRFNFFYVMFIIKIQGVGRMAKDKQEYAI